MEWSPVKGEFPREIVHYIITQLTVCLRAKPTLRRRGLGFSLESSRVLVTGGAGFIGSHVVESLLGRGWEVVVLGDFSSGREENLAAVIGRRDLRIIRGNILDRPRVSDVRKNVDVVLTYHRTYGLEVVCLRHANVYGPRRSIGPHGGVMVRFAERLAKNRPPVIFGDGTQTRDFVAGERRKCSLESIYDRRIERFYPHSVDADD